MAYQQFMGRFPITATNRDFSLTNGTGTFAIALATGYVYIRGYTSEATNNLCEDMQVKIRAADASLNAASVSYVETTGKVTIDFQSQTDITWTDSALQTILGFTGAQTSASSYTSQQQCRYVWRPTVPISDHPLSLSGVWIPRSTTRISRSKDGTLGTVKGTQIDEANLVWRCLPEADIIPASAGTTYRDLRQFFVDVIHEGELVRYQPDRTTWTLAGVHTGRIAVKDKSGGEVGSLDDLLNRKISSYNGLWDLELRFWKHV